MRRRLWQVLLRLKHVVRRMGGANGSSLRRPDGKFRDTHRASAHAIDGFASPILRNHHLAKQRAGWAKHRFSCIGSGASDPFSQRRRDLAKCRSESAITGMVLAFTC
jgi:hypothetical protein